MMVRSSLKPVLSLCLIAAAGYGAYIPLEKIRSHQIEAASKPMAVNALVSELKSRADASTPTANASAHLVFNDGRAIDSTNSYQADLTGTKL